MRRIGLPAIAIAILSACQVRSDLEGEFACVADPRCPEGLSCIAGKCVTMAEPVPQPTCATTDQLATAFDGSKRPVWADPPRVSADSTFRVTGGEMVMTVPALPRDSEVHIESTYLLDLQQRSIEVEVTSIGGGITEIGLRDATGAEVTMGVISDDLFAYAKGRFLATRPYSPTTDRWWRMRDDGEDLMFETSSDRAVWNLLSQDRVPIDSGWVYFFLNLLTNGGPAGTARFSTINPGVDSTTVWCPAATWTDAFSDGKLEPEFLNFQDNCSISEASGTLAMTVRGNPAGCGLKSGRPVDARDAILTFKMTPAVAPAITSFALFDASNDNRIVIEASDVLRFTVVAAGVQVFDTSAVRTPAAQVFWRIALSGPTVRFDTSPDATTWTTLASTVAPSLDASALQIERRTEVASPITAALTSSFGELSK